MTTKAKELLDALERELNELPEDEQIECATSYLNDLRRRKEEVDTKRAEPYSSFQVLRDARLSGGAKESTTYEQTLYDLPENNG
jgi:hypothetical protein